MLPSFIIIGAMKGGTTGLYHYLSSHPDLIPSQQKETDFFLTERNFRQGLAWYEAQFAGAGQIAFEASPNYTKRHLFPGVPKRIHSVLPEAKLIFVVRDPIERLVSHYIHNYAHGRESRSFSDAIADPKSNYILTSCYWYQLEAFLEFFPMDRIKIVVSEDLRNRTRETLDDVLQYLGLSDDINHAVLKSRFHESSGKLRHSWLERRLLPNHNVRRLPKPLRLAVKALRSPIQKPCIDIEDEEWLTRILRPNIAEFKERTGLSCHGWSI